MKEEEKRISANLPESLYSELVDEAARQERSLGVVIKRAISRYLVEVSGAVPVKDWEEPELPLGSDDAGR